MFKLILILALTILVAASLIVLQLRHNCTSGSSTEVAYSYGWPGEPAVVVWHEFPIQNPDYQWRVNPPYLVLNIVTVLTILIGTIYSIHYLHQDMTRKRFRILDLMTAIAIVSILIWIHLNEQYLNRLFQTLVLSETNFGLQNITGIEKPLIFLGLVCLFHAAIVTIRKRVWPDEDVTTKNPKSQDAR